MFFLLSFQALANGFFSFDTFYVDEYEHYEVSFHVIYCTCFHNFNLEQNKKYLRCDSSIRCVNFWRNKLSFLCFKHLYICVYAHNYRIGYC